MELFRNRGELARELLESCAKISLAPETRAEAVSADLSQLVPAEYRADHVILFRTAAGAPSVAVILEVQQQIDARKRVTWPIYLTTAEARLGCPTILLVFAPRPRVASWARLPIQLGHPGFQLRPIVISLADVPQVTDPAVAAQCPELAVLSAMAHRRLDIATAAMRAIGRLPSEQAMLYSDVILTAVPAALRHLLEAQMKGYEYQSDFARTYLEQGRIKGHEEGKQEGRQEGRKEGRRAALALARVKLEHLTEADQAAIAAVDGDALSALVVGLGQATTPQQARDAFDRVTRQPK